MPLHPHPLPQDALLAAANARKHLGVRAVIHTTMGDMCVGACSRARLDSKLKSPFSYLRLFGEYAPKTVENFCTHARAGYYDGLIFHRVIKNFMCVCAHPVGAALQLQRTRCAALLDSLTCILPLSPHAGSRQATLWATVPAPAPSGSIWCFDQR